MPCIVYVCPTHGQFERILQSHRESYPCQKCGRKCEQIISRSTVQFKGSGFHSQDYGAKTQQ